MFDVEGDIEMVTINSRIDRADLAAYEFGGTSALPLTRRDRESTPAFDVALSDVALSDVALSDVAVSDEALTCWSQIDGKARMVLDRNSQLVACSASARQIIDNCECVRIERGVVVAAQERFRKSFDDLRTAGKGRVASLLIPCSDGDGHWIVRAVESGDGSIFVTLQCANGRYSAQLADLEAAFGLTPCEARVVEGLYHGRSPQEIADEQEISIHTVRAHIRRCYDKMHISCREQLWHRLGAYQI